MFHFSNYSAESKYYDDPNALFFDKMKDEMGGVATELNFEVKPKMHLIVVSDSSKYIKAKGLNKNVVAKISHNEYKDVLLNENV